MTTMSGQKAVYHNTGSHARPPALRVLVHGYKMKKPGAGPGLFHFNPGDEVLSGAFPRAVPSTNGCQLSAVSVQ